MRFTRRIPGIRLPVPGQAGDVASAPLLFSPGWSAALVYVFLLAILGIYLFCTVRWGGEMALVWLETPVLGLSLFTLASLVNGLLVLLVLGAFLTTRPRRSMRDAKRLVGLVATLGVLGLTQVYLNNWRATAAADVEWTRTHLLEETEALRARRAELAALRDHPWAGEYVARNGDEEVRLLLAPGAEAFFLYPPPPETASEDVAALYPGLEPVWIVRKDVAVEGGRLVTKHPGRTRPERRFAVVEHGARRYLVEEEGLQAFLRSSGEPAPVDGDVFLRLGDESAALGTPRVVEGLAGGR